MHISSNIEPTIFLNGILLGVGFYLGYRMIDPLRDYIYTCYDSFHNWNRIRNLKKDPKIRETFEEVEQLAYAKKYCEQMGLLNDYNSDSEVNDERIDNSSNESENDNKLE